MATWFKIDKDSTPQPNGIYKQWKNIVRDECKGQCVYCAIGEGNFGGVRNFHLDHYRPKKLFSALENAISNLFYACSICNSFKGADWPDEPSDDFSNFCYPDPSKVDYSTILFQDKAGVVTSPTKSGQYLVERLFINRPQMILLRRREMLVDDIGRLVEKISAACAEGRLPQEQIAPAMDLLAKAYRAASGISRVAPYEINDVVRH